MEVFKTTVQGNEFVYLLDEIRENYGILDLDPEHTLVALFQPVRGISAMKLDGKVDPEMVQKAFGLDASQSKFFTDILNRHIPNKEEGD